MTDLYAVLGNPIAHSKSPDIHKQFAEQTLQAINYEKRLIPLDGFPQAMAAFIEEGGKGVNITVPFKQEAYALCHGLSKRARQAGAVNTISIDATGKMMGDNTDGAGMLQDIVGNLGWSIKGKTVLLLGAGGAVRGVLGPLLEQQPKQVFIANRTLEKAQHLAQAFSKQGNVRALRFDQIPHHALDMIINGTSASLAGDVPPLPPACIGDITHCYDMMYKQELTIFLQWAKAQGAVHLADGLGMLVEQAAEAFYLWRNVRPETGPVIKFFR